MTDNERWEAILRAEETMRACGCQIDGNSPAVSAGDASHLVMALHCGKPEHRDAAQRWCDLVVGFDADG